jgi:chromosomal replication initiation ATPase DnaA
MNLERIYGTWNYCKLKMSELDKMLQTVSAITGCDISDLKGTDRKRELVEARAAFFILTKIHFRKKYSLQRIGNVLKKDHATVVYHRNESAHISEVKSIINKYHQFINYNYGTHNPQTQTALLSDDKRRRRTDCQTTQLFS